VTDQVHLRPLRLEDERAALAASAALHDYSFFLWNDDDLPWDQYIELLANYRRGIDLPVGRVKSTFLVAEVDGNMVGRAAIRHELNEFLATVGGHIGYAVLPRYRRKGFATQILRRGGSLVGHRANTRDL
jgi:predicted acetyltransferase